MMDRRLCEICELKMVPVYYAYGGGIARLGKKGDVIVVACDECKSIAQKATGYKERSFLDTH